MQLRAEIRQRLRNSQNWHAVIEELEREAEALASESEKSEPANASVAARPMNARRDDLIT